MKKEKSAKAQEGSCFKYKSYIAPVGNKTFSTGNGYAFLLTIRGGKLKLAHDELISLEKNMLVFFKPHESFSFHTEGSEETSCLLWIDDLLTKSFWGYLGETAEVLRGIFLNDGFPPRCILSADEFTCVLHHFQFFANQDAEKEIAMLKLRLFVPYLFSVLYNKTNAEKTDQTPFWLETTCQKMKKQENFFEGISKMVQLSGRTREHLARCMKKYKRTTLSAYINELRLEYAANMLINSEMHIVDLCYESGFSSLDYFGKQFKQKYGMSPSKFRMTMQKNKR